MQSKFLICPSCIRLHTAEKRVDVENLDGSSEKGCPFCGEVWYRTYGDFIRRRILTTGDHVTECIAPVFGAERKEAAHA